VLGEIDETTRGRWTVTESDDAKKSTPFVVTSTIIFPSDTGAQGQVKILDVKEMALASTEELNRHRYECAASKPCPNTVKINPDWTLPKDGDTDVTLMMS
jgi:hypothetical protein